MKASYKVNTITSPTSAVTLEGLNVRVPLPPTVTAILAAETAVAAAKRVAKAVEKRMFTAGTQPLGAAGQDTEGHVL